jgi:hypothetical protein
MSEQVHHLLQVSVRSHIELRIIPDSAGFHAGQHPFHFMRFAGLKPVVHVENGTTAEFLQRRGTITSYQRIIDGLEAVALSPEQSREWIAHVAAAVGSGGDVHHLQRPFPAGRIW